MRTIILNTAPGLIAFLVALALLVLAYIGRFLRISVRRPRSALDNLSYPKLKVELMDLFSMVDGIDRDLKVSLVDPFELDATTEQLPDLSISALRSILASNPTDDFSVYWTQGGLSPLLYLNINGQQVLLSIEQQLKLHEALSESLRDYIDRKE